MLTKDDFEQFRKIIQSETRTIVREEVGNETQAIKDELQSDITMSQLRIRDEISELRDRVKNLELRITKMHKELKNEIKIVANTLDKDNLRTLKRVKALEQQSNMPS